MPDRYLLERVYLRSEFTPQSDDRVEAVGHLLRAVIEGPPSNPDLDRLCMRLGEAEPRTARRF